MPFALLVLVLDDVGLPRNTLVLGGDLRRHLADMTTSEKNVRCWGWNGRCRDGTKGPAGGRGLLRASLGANASNSCPSPDFL
jgi:hypothetical protein